MPQHAVLRLVPAAYDGRDSQALVDEVQLEYTLLYGQPDDAPFEEGMFDPPGGAFFLGYAGDVAVAMGGWHVRSDVHPWGVDRVAEVKRMYVAPASRRRGYARAVVAHLEATAREAGVAALVLETGTAQPEAISMYTASGFQLIDNFGHYSWSPLSRCFGKRL